MAEQGAGLNTAESKGAEMAGGRRLVERETQHPHRNHQKPAVFAQHQAKKKGKKRPEGKKSPPTCRPCPVQIPGIVVLGEKRIQNHEGSRMSTNCLQRRTVHR
jgi:hypothetical protein